MAGRQEELHGGPQERVQPFKINEFTQEAREALERDGYKIYSLQGESIKSLRDAGRSFSPREGQITHSMSSEFGRISTSTRHWHRDLPDFEALGSMQSQVAINPDKLFLPESDDKPLAQQEDMVNKFSRTNHTRAGVDFPSISSPPLWSSIPINTEQFMSHNDPLTTSRESCPPFPEWRPAGD